MDRKTSSLLLAALALGTGAGAFAWFFVAKRTGTETTGMPPMPNDNRSAAAESRPLTATTATPREDATKKVTTIDVSRSIRMPDGKYLPALNGVLNPPALTWPSGRIYSPVVGTERDTHGNDWYLHADGSKSTMQMIDMNRLGKTSREAVSYVATPQASLPVQREVPVRGADSLPTGGTAR